MDCFKAALQENVTVTMSLITYSPQLAIQGQRWQETKNVNVTGGWKKCIIAGSLYTTCIIVKLIV